MKTSYKLAFAVCALIFTGSVVYWASKKFSKHNDAGTGTVADAGTAGAATPDLTSPTAPPAPAGASLTSAPPPPAGPDTGAAAPTTPPPPAELITVAPTAPTAPTAPVAPPAPPVNPEPAKAVATAEPKAEVKAPAPATPKAAAGKTYAVRSGDTLTSISQKFFGDKNHSDEIYKANRKTIGSNPNALKVGMKLAIPAK
jgi:nucleoid-associated protein YgaU